jgi:hypothetical protein
MSILDVKAELLTDLRGSAERVVSSRLPIVSEELSKGTFYRTIGLTMMIVFPT